VANLVKSIFSCFLRIAYCENRSKNISISLSFSLCTCFFCSPYLPFNTTVSASYKLFQSPRSRRSAHSVSPKSRQKYISISPRSRRRKEFKSKKESELREVSELSKMMSLYSLGVKTDEESCKTLQISL
jgi:hypothetical protein